MDSQEFFEIFHKAWGKDRGNDTDKPTNYKKEAWTYVHTKLQEHLIAHKEKSKN